MGDARTAVPRSEEVDLNEYLDVLRRRSLIVVIATLVGSLLALGVSLVQTPIYTARAQILLEPPADLPAGIRPSQALSVETEARLLASASVAERAREMLGTRTSPNELLEHLTVQTTPDTLVLDVLYADPDPDVAAATANAFAEAYVAFRRESTLAQITARRTAIEQQLDDLRAQQRAETRVLRTTDPGSAEYQAAQDALDRLDVQITVLVSQLASLPTTIESGQVIGPAFPPPAPSSPKTVINILAGSFLGLVAGIAGAFIRDRTDDRVRSRSDLAAYLRAPLLAYIPYADPSGDGPLLERSPGSPAAEAFRAARTTVMAMADRDGARVLAIVSPLEQEGKTTTAANLGVALGYADRKVVVVSADLRRPRLHEIFGLPNERGLADVLAGTAEPSEVIVASLSPNTWVLPAGKRPDRPAELLQSRRLHEVMNQLRSSFDMVLLDCPPVLGLADCLALVPNVDAVLMVVAVDRSRGRAIAEAQEQIVRIGGVLRGAFLNQVRPSRMSNQHSYGYYAPPTEYLIAPDGDQVESAGDRSADP